MGCSPQPRLGSQKGIDMAKEETVEEIMGRWNPPPTEHVMERLIGTNPPEGDTRATASVRDERLDHDRNPGRDDIDAARLAYQDDGDGDGDGESADYSEMTNDELKDELERRGLTKSGNKDELIARLEEDDESDDDDDE